MFLIMMFVIYILMSFGMLLVFLHVCVCVRGLYIFLFFKTLFELTYIYLPTFVCFLFLFLMKYAFPSEIILQQSVEI